MNEEALNAYMDAPHNEDELCPLCHGAVRQVPRKTPFEAALAVATESEAKRWFERLEVLPVVCDQDGSGTDTGDSLDVIEAEINQATGKLTDALEELASAVKDGLKRHAAGDPNAIASDMIRSTLKQAEELLEKCDA